MNVNLHTPEAVDRFMDRMLEMGMPPGGSGGDDDDDDTTPIMDVNGEWNDDGEYTGEPGGWVYLDEPQPLTARARYIHEDNDGFPVEVMDGKDIICLTLVEAYNLYHFLDAVLFPDDPVDVEEGEPVDA